MCTALCNQHMGFPIQLSYRICTLYIIFDISLMCGK